MPFPALEEVQGKLGERRKTLQTIFEQAGDETDLSKVNIIKGDTFAKAQQIKNLNDECTDLGKELETLLAVQQAGERAKMAGDLGGESGDGSGEVDTKRSGGLGALE